MAALDLPAGPAGLLDRTRVHLAAHLGGEHQLILGGGTALIARWKHRWTHDLDFFIEAGPYARLQENRTAFEHDLRTVSGIREANVRPHNALILFEDGGEISIGTTPAFTDNPRSTDTVRGTAVVLETTAEILAKKIGGRILRNNTFVPRDLYDLVIARHLGACPSSRRADDGVRRRSAAGGPVRSSGARRSARRAPVPVVAPSDPEAARRAPRTVRLMLDQPRRR